MSGFGKCWKKSPLKSLGCQLCFGNAHSFAIQCTMTDFVLYIVYVVN